VHELSYCEGVLEAVERRAAGRPVTRVGVRIGAVHRVVPQAFQHSFALAALGGPAENARTELVVVPVQGHCLDCRLDFDSPDPSPACPGCGGLDVAVHGGDEVVLEWLEYAGPAGPAETAGAAEAAETAGAADRVAQPVPAHTHPEGS
jgi:hydrogenase nickel incorporation protein HypA/HybF